MSENTKYLTTKQIAEELQVSQITVRRWIDNGLLKGHKFGRNFRVSIEEYEQFKKQNNMDN